MGLEAVSSTGLETDGVTLWLDCGFVSVFAVLVVLRFAASFFNILKHRTEFLSYFEDKYCQVWGWAQVVNTPTNILMHRTALPPIVKDLSLFRAFLTW